MSIRNALLAAAILAAIASPASAQQTITKSVTVAPDATVEVSNVQGSVEVIGLGSQRTRARRRAREQQGRARIRGDRAHGAHRGRPAAAAKYHDDEDDAYLTLHVPKGARLIVDTVSADITSPAFAVTRTCER